VGSAVWLGLWSGSAIVLRISPIGTYLLSDRTAFIGDYIRWVPAAWISANGNRDNPTKAFGDTSALKAGPMAEFMLYPTVAGGFLHYLDIAAFYQTDFYGIAEAEGGTVGWTPVNPNLFLGAINSAYKPYFVNGFLELRGEFTDVNVGTLGMTNLLAHNYESDYLR
jgi:hypothetical protein